MKIRLSTVSSSRGDNLECWRWLDKNVCSIETATTMAYMIVSRFGGLESSVNQSSSICRINQIPGFLFSLAISIFLFLVFGRNTVRGGLILIGLIVSWNPCEFAPKLLQEEDEIYGILRSKSSCNKLLLFVSWIEAGDASSGCSPPLSSSWPVLSPLLEPHSPSTNLQTEICY